MKKIFFINAFVLVFVLMGFTNTDKASNALNLVGTWTYSAPDADYQYQEGELIFKETDGDLSGHVAIDQSVIDLNDIVVKGNTVTANLYLEGEEISLKLGFKDKSFSGAVSFSGGELSISGKKKSRK